MYHVQFLSAVGNVGIIENWLIFESPALPRWADYDADVAIGPIRLERMVASVVFEAEARVGREEIVHGRGNIPKTETETSRHQERSVFCSSYH